MDIERKKGRSFLFLGQINSCLYFFPFKLISVLLNFFLISLMNERRKKAGKYAKLFRNEIQKKKNRKNEEEYFTTRKISILRTNFTFPSCLFFFALLCFLSSFRSSLFRAFLLSFFQLLKMSIYLI